MDSSQYQGSDIARVIWIVGSPIIFAVGVPGNLITIIVLLRSNNKRTSTSVFLTFLAVSDVLVLILLLPRWWIIYVFGIDIRHANNAFCKLHWFFTYSSGCVSSAVLVAVTVERIISIIRPYKVKTWCTVNTAIVTSVTIIVVLIAFHWHNLHGMKLFRVTQYQDSANHAIHCIENRSSVSNRTTIRSNNTDQSMSELGNITAVRVWKVCKGAESQTCFNITDNNMLIDQENFMQNETCELFLRKEISISVCWFDDPEYGKFYMGPYTLMVIFIYNVITEVSILVGIIVILRQLAASKRLRKRIEMNVARESGAKAKKSSFNTYSAQITRSLLLVSTVFLFCTTPVQIFLAGRSVWIDTKAGMTLEQELLFAIFNMMFYINHAVNFILYFLSGTRFRKQVRETFRCNKQRKELNGLSLSHIASVGIANRRSDFGRSVSSVGNFQ